VERNSLARSIGDEKRHIQLNSAQEMPRNVGDLIGRQGATEIACQLVKDARLLFARLCLGRPLRKQRGQMRRDQSDGKHDRESHEILPVGDSK
jgi:hypothetical protein